MLGAVFGWNTHRMDSVSRVRQELQEYNSKSDGERLREDYMRICRDWQRAYDKLKEQYNS